MLLVTFHGGSAGVTNVYSYDTTNGVLNTPTALQKATLTKAELRGVTYANGYLYVVNGGKDASNIMCFSPPAAGATMWNFEFIGEFISPLINKKKFDNAIGHPYSIQFSSPQVCYISNQDTNVVAQAQVAASFQTATIEAGCASQYLSELINICPNGVCVYLDGTFVASQVGALPDVKFAAPNVPDANGGLAVKPATDIKKVQNSVRDLAIFGSVLFVCDEPQKVIRLYSLTDGTYLGKSSPLAKSPTHLVVFDNGLYVSAGDQLYWSALSSSPTPSSLSFQSVLTAPAASNPYSVGGVTFDPATDTAYVAFQQGKGQTGSGAIYSYSVSTASTPAFTNAIVFATICADTPEFVLFMPNP
jgi:hypothetical protein